MNILTATSLRIRLSGKLVSFIKEMKQLKGTSPIPKHLPLFIFADHGE